MSRTGDAEDEVEDDIYDDDTSLERENLHAFFTAHEDGQYLIIVRNESADEIEIRLRVSYVD